MLLDPQFVWRLNIQCSLCTTQPAGPWSAAFKCHQWSSYFVQCPAGWTVNIKNVSLHLLIYILMSLKNYISNDFLWISSNFAWSKKCWFGHFNEKMRLYFLFTSLGARSSKYHSLIVYLFQHWHDCIIRWKAQLRHHESRSRRVTAGVHCYSTNRDPRHSGGRPATGGHTLRATLSRLLLLTYNIHVWGYHNR